MQALITDHLIFKILGEIYSDHLEYDIPQDERDESDPIMLGQYLSNMTAKRENTPDINHSMQYPVITTPLPYILCISL